MDHFDFSEIEHDDRYGWAEKPIVSVFLQESFYYAQNGVNGSIVETTCLPCTYLFICLYFAKPWVSTLIYFFSE